MKKLLVTSILLFSQLVFAASSTSLPVASNPLAQSTSDQSSDPNDPNFKEIMDLQSKVHEKVDKLILIYSLISNTTPHDLRGSITATCKPYMQSLLSQDDRQKAIAELSTGHKNILSQLEQDSTNNCGDSYIVQVGAVMSAFLDDEQLATAYNFYTSDLGKKWIKYRTTYGYTQNDSVEKAFTSDERAQITALADNPAIKATESFFTEKIDDETVIKKVSKATVKLLNIMITEFKRTESLDK